jgi:nicotinamidase-related amidase
MLLELQDSQLVLVDYQSQLMPVMHDGEAVLRNGVRLAQMAHLLKVPTWGTEQNPERLGHNPVEISEVCRRTLAKMSFGACEEGLGEVLRPQASAPSGNARSLPRHLQKAVPAPVRNSVVIAGCEAHICLLQTALGLLEEEFEVWVVTDACASRSERNRDAAFDRLAGAGAELLTTEMVAFEWLRTAEHPQFKAVQALIK